VTRTTEPVKSNEQEEAMAAPSPAGNRSTPRMVACSEQ
jgi:hypothetical protein